MRRHLLTLLLVLTPATALAGRLDRLTTAEREHFRALQVWMDKKDQKAFLKLKTEEDRTAWLKAQGLYERFYRYPAERRGEILAGNVAEGWTEDQVFMAWGQPHQKKRLARPGAQRTESLVYLLEVTPDRKVLVWKPGSKATHGAIDRYRYEVILADGVVRELVRKDGWDL